MTLQIGEVYCIRGYKDPLCFAISEEVLATRLPAQDSLSFVGENELDFIHLPGATLIDLMRSWSVTTEQFNHLMGPIMKSIYQQKPEKVLNQSSDIAKQILDFAIPAPQRAKKSKVTAKIPAIKRPSEPKPKPKPKPKRVAETKISEQTPEDIERALLEMYAPQLREVKRVVKEGSDEAIKIAIKDAVFRNEISARAIAKQYHTTHARVVRLGKTIGIDYGKLREQRRAKILYGRKHGASITELARRYKISTKQVKVICREAGLKTEKKLVKRRQTRNEKILAAVIRGEPLEQISAKYGPTPHYIRYHIAGPAGIKLSAPRAHWKAKRPEVIEALKTGEAVTAIARRLNVNQVNVRRLKKRLGL